MLEYDYENKNQVLKLIKVENSYLRNLCVCFGLGWTLGKEACFNDFDASNEFKMSYVQGKGDGKFMEALEHIKQSQGF